MAPKTGVYGETDILLNGITLPACHQCCCRHTPWTTLKNGLFKAPMESSVSVFDPSAFPSYTPALFLARCAATFVAWFCLKAALRPLFPLSIWKGGEGDRTARFQQPVFPFPLNETARSQSASVCS